MNTTNEQLLGLDGIPFRFEVDRDAPEGRGEIGVDVSVFKHDGGGYVGGVTAYPHEVNGQWTAKEDAGYPMLLLVLERLGVDVETTDVDRCIRVVIEETER